MRWTVPVSVRLTRDLTAEGFGSAAIRRMVRAQELHHVRRGAFCAALGDGADRHLQLIQASLPRLGAGHVLSHATAAVLQFLPVDMDALDRVTVTRPGTGGSWIGPYVHRYRTPLGDGDIEVVDGLARTVMARTVIDLGRCGDLAFAVAAADRALRKGLAREQLLDQLEAGHRRHGIARARTMVELADPRSESPGESLSRVVMWRLGIPAAELQFEVVVGGCTYRSDFAWPQSRVLGEFDGKVKYRELLKPGQTAADVVMKEKRRDAELRSAGWWVVHWSYADLLHPERLERLLRPALLRSG